MSKGSNWGSNWDQSKKASRNRSSVTLHRIPMNLKLEGKRALVSGSSAGIGYAIAEALAIEGASVIINGRTQQRVDQALDSLARSGVRGSVTRLAADLGTAEGVRKAISRFTMLRFWLIVSASSKPSPSKRSPTRTGCAFSKSTS